MKPSIESPKNPLIQSFRKLHQANHRQRQKRFLVEGTHAVQEALAVDWPIEWLCFSQRWLDRGELDLALLKPSIRCLAVSEAVLEAIATTEQPDGVVAIADSSICRTVAEPRSLAIAVDRLQSPGNLGTLLRGMAAAGGEGVYLGRESIDTFHPKVIRASAGQWFRNPPQTVPLADWLGRCRSRGMQVLAAQASGRSFWTFDLTRPTIFLLGNEGQGLSESLQEMADDSISVPMHSAVESLNVGVSGTLLLYEAIRQRSAYNCRRDT